MTYNYPEVVASRKRHAVWFAAQGPALPKALAILQTRINSFSDTNSPGCRVLIRAYWHIANPPEAR